VKVKVGGFKNIIRKATLNMAMDSVQINFDPDRIKSKMISRDSSAILLLDVPNDVFTGVGGSDSHTLNFVEPNQNLMPFLNLFEDGSEIDLVKTDSAITLKQGKQKSTVRLSVEQAVSVFTRPGVNASIRSFVEFQMDSDFIEAYSKIKKVGARFGKVYFNVESNVLYMETTDREEGFSNSLKMEIQEVERDNINLCFNYKNFVNVMTVVNSDYEDFKLSISAAPVGDIMMGMISAEKEDGSEKYYLMSTRENL